MFTATDLPEPVVPAISRWGIFARSARTGAPPISLPSARASLWTDRSKLRAAIISRRKTVSRFWFGNSIPITLRPGTTATRTDRALIDRAISSARLITRDDFTPGAGSSS